MPPLHETGGQATTQYSVSVLPSYTQLSFPVYCMFTWENMFMSYQITNSLYPFNSTVTMKRIPVISLYISNYLSIIYLNLHLVSILFICSYIIKFVHLHLFLLVTDRLPCSLPPLPPIIILSFS